MSGINKIKYEVRRLFEKSGIDEFQPNRKSGILDSRRLHTVATGNDRVFKRHVEEGGIDSAVTFILDCSGSMFGYEPRMKTALPVLWAMLDTLDRAGVATSVITFGTRTSMLKPWGMPKSQAKDMLQRITNGGDNSDSTALRFAHSLLMKRPEQRKIAFIFADGGVDMADQKRCLEQAKTGERLGITTIGVGIEANLSGMYTNHVVVNSLKDLASTSFKQIKLVGQRK